MVDAPDVVFNGHAQTDDIIRNAMRIRIAARLATLAYNDNEALRRALRARPRVAYRPRPGGLVAFWR
eukprot:3008576-Lingulodinium_polyedra.AAC.1